MLVRVRKIQARRIPEKNGIAPPTWFTNQSKFLANTFSPGNPHTERIALRRDLVVTDCQPPSNRLNEVVTHRGDMIAVQIHKRNVADSDNLSVARFEVATIGDSIDHLLFDLTHDWSREWFGGGGVLVPPPDVFNIDPWRWGHKGACDTCSTGTLQAYLWIICWQDGQPKMLQLKWYTLTVSEQTGQTMFLPLRPARV